MSQGPTLNERAAYITDGGRTQLDFGQSPEVRLIAELLADASTWTEPTRRLGDTVVDAVTGLASGSRRPRRRVLKLVAGAALVLAILAIGFGIVARKEAHAEFAAELRPTVSAPNASASAELYRNRSGFRVVLDAHDLPTLPPGGYYQAWLKNAAGAVVPIGSFSSSRDEVTLWSGASPAGFVRMMVTMESKVDHLGSSGPVVLVGELRPS
jgi:hypothetical protein